MLNNIIINVIVMPSKWQQIFDGNLMMIFQGNNIFAAFTFHQQAVSEIINDQLIDYLNNQSF